MAIPKKGLRKITVNEQEYLWLARTDGDAWGEFSLTVCRPDRKGQLLTAYVNIISEKGILIITNYIVRQMILLGLANNWAPSEDKAPLNLKGINEKIDLESAIYLEANK